MRIPSYLSKFYLAIKLLSLSEDNSFSRHVDSDGESLGGKQTFNQTLLIRGTRQEDGESNDGSKGWTLNCSYCEYTKVKMMRKIKGIMKTKIKVEFTILLSSVYIRMVIRVYNTIFKNAYHKETFRTCNTGTLDRRIQKHTIMRWAAIQWCRSISSTHHHRYLTWKNQQVIKTTNSNIYTVLTWKSISMISFKMGKRPPWWMPTPLLRRGRIVCTCKYGMSTSTFVWGWEKKWMNKWVSEWERKKGGSSKFSKVCEWRKEGHKSWGKKNKTTERSTCVPELLHFLECLWLLQRLRQQSRLLWLLSIFTIGVLLGQSTPINNSTFIERSAN